MSMRMEFDTYFDTFEEWAVFLRKVADKVEEGLMIDSSRDFELIDMDKEEHTPLECEYPANVWKEACQKEQREHERKCQMLREIKAVIDRWGE